MTIIATWEEHRDGEKRDAEQSDPAALGRREARGGEREEDGVESADAEDDGARPEQAESGTGAATPSALRARSAPPRRGRAERPPRARRTRVLEGWRPRRDRGFASSRICSCVRRGRAAGPSCLVLVAVPQPVETLRPFGVAVVEVEPAGVADGNELPEDGRRCASSRERAANAEAQRGPPRRCARGRGRVAAVEERRREEGSQGERRGTGQGGGRERSPRRRARAREEAVRSAASSRRPAASRGAGRERAPRSGRRSQTRTNEGWTAAAAPVAERRCRRSRKIRAESAARRSAASAPSSGVRDLRERDPIGMPERRRRRETPGSRARRKKKASVRSRIAARPRERARAPKRYGARVAETRRRENPTSAIAAIRTASARTKIARIARRPSRGTRTHPKGSRPGEPPQPRSNSPFSSVVLTDAMNLSASAPSIRRWSKESARYPHRPDAERVVAVLVGDDDRPLLDRADAEDRDLRLRDDRRAEERAEDARVRHGEGAALDLLGLQPLRPRPLREVLRGAREAQDRLLVGVLDDRARSGPSRAPPPCRGGRPCGRRCCRRRSRR